MAISIDAVLIDTADAERLVAFYRDVVGVPLVAERHGGAKHYGCDLGGLHFAIHGGAAAKPGAVTPSFGVDDVDAVVARARAAGHRIEQEPADRPFGRLASVRDPDGNLV